MKDIKIQKIYRHINKIDSQIMSLQIRKQVFIKKISKTDDDKKAKQYLSVVEDIMEKIRILEKRKTVFTQVMASLTSMVEIDIWNDPYIEIFIQEEKINSKEHEAGYLYGCVNNGYTVFSNDKVSSIQHKMNLEEFEKIQSQKKIQKNNSRR